MARSAQVVFSRDQVLAMLRPHDGVRIEQMSISPEGDLVLLCTGEQMPERSSDGVISKIHPDLAFGCVDDLRHFRPGDRVCVISGRAGWPGDMEWVLNFVKRGERHEVAEVKVHQSLTTIRLVGNSNWFNSVCFERSC